MNQDGRDFLRDGVRKRVDFSRTAQNLGRPEPPRQKPVAAGKARIVLPGSDAWNVSAIGLEEAIARRRSHRRFAAEPLALEELAFLLWATQGLRAKIC
jgi:hypothetical protein